MAKKRTPAPAGQGSLLEIAPGEWNVERQRRFAQIAVRALPGDGEDGMAPGVVDPTSRTLSFPFSSQEPVARWFGDEILSHAAGAADFSRLNDGAPLLFNHDMDNVIGVVERAYIGDDLRGYVTVRFAKTPEADQIVAMIDDGILRNVSFAYEADKYVATQLDDDGDADAYTATSWKAYEVSIVSVPADPTVGVGRAHESTMRPVTVERRLPASTPAAPAAISEIKAMENTTTGGAAAAPFDEAALRVQIQQDEGARVREIEATRARFPEKFSREEADKLIREGKTVADVRGLVLERMLANPAQPVANFGHAAVDMGDKDARAYSVVRAINAALNNDWREAGLEREVHDTIAKARGGQSKGLLLPSNLPFCPTPEHERAYRSLGARGMQTRATYQVGTAGSGTTGGTLVATNLLAADFIEVLRNASVTAQLGARMLTGLVGNVDIPRQTAQTTTYWVGESSAVTESEGTFDKLSMKARTLGALSVISRLMLLQSTPAIEMIVREDLVRVLALAIDLAAISGSGSGGQPTGIVNTSGVGSVVGGTNGANITFDNIIQLYSQPRIANAPQANLAFAMNPHVYGYLSAQKSTTGQYLWMPQGGIMNAPGDTVRGYPYVVSNQLRSTLTKGSSSGICSETVFGNWQELFIAEWGVLELLVNPYDSAGFTTGDVKIRALQDVDIGVRHAASFAVMSDGLTPGY